MKLTVKHFNLMFAMTFNKKYIALSKWIKVNKFMCLNSDNVGLNSLLFMIYCRKNKNFKTSVNELFLVEKGKRGQNCFLLHEICIFEALAKSGKMLKPDFPHNTVKSNSFSRIWFFLVQKNPTTLIFKPKLL